MRSARLGSNIGFVLAVLLAPQMGSSANLPSQLTLAEIERLTPNDRVGYFQGLQSITNKLDAEQSRRFREGWAEEPHAKPSACLADGLVSHTEAFVRPSDCRQYEKTVDGMLTLRYCWTAKRHCVAPTSTTWAGQTFRCAVPARRPCNPFVFGLQKRNPMCAKVNPGATGLCRGSARADGIPRAVRALGLQHEFDRFAANGFAPLCEGRERNRVFDDRACEHLAEHLHRHIAKYRAKIPAP